MDTFFSNVSDEDLNKSPMLKVKELKLSQIIEA